MTDVYIAYAREDREKVRILSDMLRFEGWDVWVDPSSPTEDNSAAIDLKLGSAGAILVVWSGYSRGSEQVRSEAATGLYKNKLIQVRVDQAAPPRPFDQVEVIDLGMWSGEREDPNWRRIVSSVRLYAGAPGASRPQVTRRATSGPAYLEPARSIAWGPLVAAGVLVVAGAGVWLADPFGWRDPQVTTATNDTVATSAATPIEGAAVVETSGAMFEDTEQSTAEWGRVNRDSADGLRNYVVAFPRASSAETARSLLRVMDAQAWVHAVTADNESGYQAYLEDFPVDASMPGAMAAAARDRLVSLSAERSQAIEDIQRGLLVLKFYKGDIDGKGGNGTARAVKDFATSRNRTFPTLSTAAPRDLRAFAEIVAKAAGTSPSSKAPIIATATTPAKPASAEDADRDRIAKAQAAIQAASKAATETAATQAAVSSGADSGAVSELQKMADQNAWTDAEKVGTLAAYQNYLVAHPSGAQTAAAKAAVTRLSRPTPYSLELVPAEVKAAADAARKAQTSANSRAAQARETAAAADSAPGAREIVAADGDKYQAQISGGAPNGLGVRVSGASGNAGDRYRGELRNGQTAGLGVYEYGSNPGNSSSGALRYEGEHSSDAASGYGVTYWKNGDSFAGLGNGPNGVGRGVLTFSNGQRYEGEMRNGTRNGYGVVWSPDGSILMAGRWVNGELVEPAAKSDGQ